MRVVAAPCLLLAACTTGQGEANNLAEPSREAAPATVIEAAPAPESGPNIAAPSLEPPEDPGLAAMSPYRRRQYERGWRDCMTGNYDRKRQGESYRIGCMAAEEAKEAAGR